MSLLDSISRVLRDPPPAYAFELSEAGVAYSASSRAGEVHFREFEPGVIAVSPARDNVLNQELFGAEIGSLFQAPASRNKRRNAALILPDHSARVQVLDFDSFPGGSEEQAALVRFRIKKSVPFDIESATVSYHVQPASGGKKVEVVAAAMSLEIAARYEAAFRSAGFAPGFVTTSAIAALNLMPPAGLNILVKLSGKILSAMAVDGTRLKLVRTIELEAIDTDEIMAVLHPTLAYLEDELGTKVGRLFLCGFGLATEQRWAIEWEVELGIPVEPLQSRFGTPGPYNAGLLGYLESAGGLQ